MIDRCHTRDPIAKSVADDDGRAAAVVSDYRCNVACEIVQRQAFHRSAAPARAARLRPQHAEAGLGEARSDVIEIVRITAARRKENDQRSAAFGYHFDAHIVVSDDPPRALGLCPRRGQRDQTC